MIMLKLCFLLCLSWLVVSCGDDDNTEPPAELVSFVHTASLVLDWVSDTQSATEQQYYRVEPLVVDDKIIISSRDGEISVVNIGDGEVLKTIVTGSTVSGGVGGNEKLWLLATADGELIAIDAEKAAVAWKVELPSEVLSRPVAYNNQAYVRTVDGQTVCVDLSNGSIKWAYKQSKPALTLRGSSSPVIARDQLFVGLPSGRLVALSHENGSVLWDVALAVPQGHSEIQRLVDIDGQAELYGYVLYAASFQGRVAAIDMQKGRFLWARDFSSYTGVSVDDKTLYSADERSHIWALDRYNGATLWKQEKLQGRRVTRPVISGDYIIVGDYDGYLHVMSRFDGHFVARVQLGDAEIDDVGDSGIVVAPVVIGDRIIVTTRNGILHSYSLRKLTSTE